MKMTKTVLLTSILSALAFQASAGEIVNIYGKANVTLQSSDDGDGRFSEIKSNASRFGVKGDYKANDDITVVYKMEWQIDISDESGADNVKSRNQYVGLKGAFGEVVVGRNDTATKQSQGKIDLFNDLEADIKALWKSGGNGENRVSDSVTYKSPKFGGFQAVGTFIAEDSKAGENGYSAALMYGDSKLKKSPVFASVAVDSEVAGYDVVRATVQGKVAGIKLGAMYQNSEEVVTKTDMDGFVVNAAYGFGKTTLKAQYQSADFENNLDTNVISAGVDYKLAKNTKIFAFYSSFDNDTVKADTDYLGVGLEFKF